MHAEIDTTCSNYDAKTGDCRLLRWSCPFDRSGFRDCGQCSFLARLKMPPDEFQVLVDKTGKPTQGFVPLTRCRVTNLHAGAGVHVNAILNTSGGEPLLGLHPQPDGSILLQCDHTEAGVLWRDGQFSPSF